MLAQAIQALAAGNAALVVSPGAPAAVQPLLGKGLPLAAIDGSIDPAMLRQLRIDVVASAADADTLRQLRQALAGRDGPIVPLVTEIIYPAAYAHERSVCVDTTAAGGNASLLASA
jgi:RHH-type proline utilization regulon transcriptional repressor/proline dehydrogenase/delta 1-pyrroline-5-carboxylate dehydrogenase